MTTDPVRVQLLGAVAVTAGDKPRALSGLRRKSLLAVLALHPGETVSTDRLIDIMWGEAPPATALNTLQRHVSYLRDVLGRDLPGRDLPGRDLPVPGGRDAIVSRPPGYCLALPAGATDVAMAEALIAESRAAGDPAAAAAALRSALDLWRGQSLADVDEVPWLAEQAMRLEQLRLEASQALVEARLATGEHAALIPELEQLAQRHPFREQIHGQLMLALYRSGRQADALAASRRLRRSMRAELGLDPGPALRDLEAAILRQDGALDPPSRAAVPPPSGLPVPAQLPRAVPGFAGRACELARLDSLGPTATVAVLSGSPGVGKTTLALGWAHSAARRFPDGQLYLNLRGFDPSAPALAPAEALRVLLDGLGVPAGQVPPGLDARAGLYRSILAARRILVVLDNARDEEQVRPLLPGSPGCLVVVTSRSQLAGLVVTDGAYPVHLDLPPAAEARDMLAGLLGAARVAAEPAAAAEIVARCARLPLALAVAASRAVSQGAQPLAELAAQLGGSAAALASFEGSDAATDVRAVFSWSYQALSPRAARLFRWLGLCPGPEVSLDAAASLAGLPPERAAVLLAELTSIHLLTEPEPGRYAFHDLLRAYARELAGSAGWRSPARRRVLDHYLHTAHAAAMLLSPDRDAVELAPAAPGVTVTRLADLPAAMAWFGRELPALATAITRDSAARHEAGGERADRETADCEAAPGDPGRDDCAAAACGAAAVAGWRSWQLAWTLVTFLGRRGSWEEESVVAGAALTAAQTAGDVPGQAHAHRMLGSLSVSLGRLADAGQHNQAALRLFGVSGDHLAQASIQLALAWAADEGGDPVTALRHADFALRTYELAGHRRGCAHALNIICWCSARLGRLETALARGEQAVALFLGLSDQAGLASAWDSLGSLHLRRRDPGKAITCYAEALAIHREIGDRYNEADVRASLGDCHDVAGDSAAALASWQLALTILERLRHRDADRVRSRIEAAGRTAPPAGRLDDALITASAGRRRNTFQLSFSDCCKGGI